MRKIRKRKTNRNLIYGIVFSAMLFLTVGYSVLTTSLNFNITAHKNSVTYEVGDQVEVLGLTQTFHVVEVGEDYLKLLSDQSEGFSKVAFEPISKFEDSEVYSTLNFFTRNWKSNITSAGGTTNYYNVNLISKAEIQNLILSKDSSVNLSGTIDFASLGLSWLTDYTYVHDHIGDGSIIGFFTNTLEPRGSSYVLANLVSNPGHTTGFFNTVLVGTYTYGMDIRPYLTIDIGSVKKI